MSKQLTKIATIINEISMGPFGSDIKVENFVNEGVPVLNGSNLTGFKLVENGFKYVTPEKAKTFKKAIAKRGDIVITHRGTLGQISFIPDNSNYEEYVISQSQFRVALNRKLVDPVFFVYYFHTSEGQKRLLANKCHVGVPALAQATTNFKLVEIPLPNIKIQQKIASVLFTIDSKIELNNRINAELEMMAKTLYYFWFVQFDFPFDFAQGKPDPKGKPYKTSGGKMVWNEQLKREIPEGWEVETLNEIIDLILDHRGKTPLKLGGDWANSGDGIIALSAKHVKGGKLLNLEQANRVTNEMYKKWMPEKLIDGDILMTSEAPLGEFYFLLNYTNYCMSQRLFAIRANQSKVIPSYLYYELSKGNGYSQIIGGQSGSTVFGIRQDELRKIKVLKPGLRIQTSFDEIVRPMLAKIRNNDFQNQQLAELRDWLLPMLMNGQVTVGETTNIEVKKVERNSYHINMQKLLHVARELHKRGYEKLRVVPSLSPSGMSWRCSFVADPENGIVTSTWLSEYSPNEREIEYSIIELTELFEREHMRFLESCKGKNKDYVEWYQNMLSHLEEDELPYAFAEYFSPTDYWKTTNDHKIETLPNEKNFYYGY